MNEDAPAAVSVLCLGATGAVGRFLVPRLVAAGHAVIAVSRSAPPPDSLGVHWQCGDLDRDIAIDAAHGIVSAGPLDHFAAWLERVDLAGVRRVVALSSMSAASKAESVDAAERELAARLAASEDRLIRRCDAAGIGWTLLRPTLIYGAARDRSLTRIARLAMRTRFFPLVPFARGLRQPVHADDLAMACVAALMTPVAAGRRFEVGGGERLPYGTMLSRVRHSLGFRTWPVPIPISVMHLATRVLRRGRGMVHRFGVDLIADNGPAEAVLGYRPRPFNPSPACWFDGVAESADSTPV